MDQTLESWTYPPPLATLFILSQKAYFAIFLQFIDILGKLFVRSSLPELEE